MIERLVRGGETLRGVARANWMNLAFVGAAILYAIPSFFYPFGRDQSILYYVGREWLRGRMPYRDALDVKPPAIYLVHALAIDLFGEHQWGIRVFDLLVLFAIAAISAWLVKKSRGDKMAAWGPMCLLVVALYYSIFDFWETAQVEIWESLSLLAAYAVARTWRRLHYAGLVSGALVALACLFKLTAVVVGIVPAVVLLARAFHARPTRLQQLASTALAALAFLAGGMIVVFELVGYFSAHFALKELLDVVIGYTLHYAKFKQTPLAVGLPWARRICFDQSRLFFALLALSAMVGVSVGKKETHRGPRRDTWMAVIFVLAAGISVAMQRKFWSYHWIVALGPVALVIGYGVAEMVAASRGRGIAATWIVAMLSFLGAPTWVANDKVSTYIVTKHFWQYRLGSISRDAYLADFINPVIGYLYAPEEEVGNLVRDRARPGDKMIVRGFEPAIYVVSGLASPSPFASEAPLLDPTLDYRREEWLARHEHMCWVYDPPRFAVTFTTATYDIERITERGYHPIATVERFVVLEKNE